MVSDTYLISLLISTSSFVARNNGSILPVEHTFPSLSTFDGKMQVLELEPNLKPTRNLKKEFDSRGPAIQSNLWFHFITQRRYFGFQPGNVSFLNIRSNQEPSKMGVGLPGEDRQVQKQTQCCVIMEGSVRTRSPHNFCFDSEQSLT